MDSPFYFAKGKEYPDSEGFITVARRRKMNSSRKGIQVSTRKLSFSNKSCAKIAASTNVFSVIGFGNDEPTKEKKETFLEAEKVGQNKEISTEEKVLICWKPLYSLSEVEVSVPKVERKVRFAMNVEIIELEPNEPEEEEKETQMPAESNAKANMKKKMENMDLKMKKLDLKMKKTDLKMKQMDLKMKQMDLEIKKMDYKMKKRAFKIQVRKNLPPAGVLPRPSSRDSNIALAKAKVASEFESLQRLIVPL
ncbi:hypothetical protein FOB63_004307 [Clavispora lusitaniae]|uniref:Uncharacterized protein n=1 Tax=Clavispora lusitaniae (strain ATCC 42720) TaxID=306902 RepID=C4Y9K2_CLAL4|nr:uncharacterized protein CLUG_04892 [Clavispora lusitaniae ATCC 42720]EEQ40764.1 predicted protein [Clavispora lusitaniae ATCC 42720]KAF7581005.1 hypothetical protein FOB63_004307 [Clavispora lusitaniae]